MRCGVDRWDAAPQGSARERGRSSSPSQCSSHSFVCRALGSADDAPAAPHRAATVRRARAGRAAVASGPAGSWKMHVRATVERAEATMRRRLRKILGRSALAVLAACAVYLALLICPDPLFAHELSARAIVLHSDEPIPSGASRVLALAEAKV